jgi:hypothetical protein
LFFFEIDDSWPARILLYGSMTIAWVVLTAWGFAAVTRTSSLMTTGFLVVLVWMLFRVLVESDARGDSAFLFESQLDADVLANMGISSSVDKFVFALNLLIGPLRKIHRPRGRGGDDRHIHTVADHVDCGRHCDEIRGARHDAILHRCCRYS